MRAPAITITVGAAANQPPVLSAIGNRTVNEGSLLSFTATATDPDAGQTRTFSLDAGAPAGAAITAGGAFTWTPTEAQGPGSYPVTVRVTDNGSPAASDFETITVTVNEVNVAPVLAPIGNRTGTPGSPVTFTATATDADVPAQTRTFSLGAGAPAGAAITAGGAFSWTPAQAGSFPVTVIVADSGSPSLNDSEAITITVSAVPVTLRGVAVTGPPSVNEGSTGNYTATATWSDGSTSNVTSQSIWTENSTFATIAGGVLSASQVTANQTVTVTAIYAPAGSTQQTGSMTVTIVNVAATLSSIAVTGPSSVNEGSTGNYTATATWSDGSNTAVTPVWSTSLGTISTAGLFTAPSVTANQTATIGASFTSGGVTRTASASVTVVDATPPTGADVSVMPTTGATDVPVNTVVTATETGTGNIVSIFNEQTFTLKVKGPAPPDGSCVAGGFVSGAISYNGSNTAGTFTPTCPLANGTVYTATIASSAGGLSAPRAWEFTTIAAGPDTDGDGVPDNEDDHPGDKGKGSPPSSRGRGKFLVDVTGTAGASLAFTEGIAETHTSLNHAGKPTGYEFPDGLASYQVITATPGGSVTVKVTFPSGIPAGSKVYKVGPAGFQEVGNPAIQGNTVTLTLTDGGTGDSDGVANGVIVDPVGVATPVASGSGPLDLSNSSSGGGCAVVPGKASGGAGAVAPLLLLLAGAVVRRLRKPGRGR